MIQANLPIGLSRYTKVGIVGQYPMDNACKTSRNSTDTKSDELAARDSSES